MPRYAALLRGVSPMNCKMPALKNALELGGFTDVKTVISSGNAVFSSRAAPIESLQKKCEAAMAKHMGKSFMTIVRSVDDLDAILATNPYGKLPDKSKRVVTFLREEPASKPKLPIDRRNARILKQNGGEVFSYYLPIGLDPAFMVIIEKTYGKNVTTRTWETVGRIVKAGKTS
jgi:uncharacterized protein (DUF1697 family)